MNDDFSKFESNDLVNMLNTENKDKAMGQLIANSINTVNDLNKKNIELLIALKKSSDDTTNVYKKIMWLTIVICVATFKNIYDFIIEIFKYF
ncbi:MAG: hypothetical protein A2220_11095 [Ignavibacteria bacterium RIFOXYA2_FULL_35_10]|nr:MAG: hypothetical protein A2220_11095 [Ignavibacteria bacterium RIFOXYA2_FULL_35_10]